MAVTVTVTKFLNDAAASIGAVEPGQSLSSNRLTYWLGVFNDMVRNMSADRLFLFFVPDVPYTLTGESTTIGPGGTLNTTGGANTRPVFVESARVLIATVFRKPLNILTEQEWSTDPHRGSTNAAGPIDFYYGSNITLGTFNLAPAPTAHTVYISQWNPLKVFDPTTDMALLMGDYYPEEYIRALGLNLAVNQARAHGLQVSQDLIGNASTALQTIRNLNAARLGGSMGQSNTLQAPSVGAGKPQAV